MKEVTDSVVEELNYESDWIVSDFAPQSGINHFDKQGNCTLVKRGLYLHEAKALCKELNNHEAKIAAKLNDAYEASVFCATELY